MSTTLRQTLIGTYDELESLFDDLTLPDGYDKNDFIDSLLLEHGEKGVIYSNPLFMKKAIGIWGRKHYHDLERIHLALTEEYNPLYNFDRHEESSDTRSGGKSTLHDYTQSGSYTRTSDDVLEHDRVSDTETEEKTSAFNSSDYEPSNKTVVSGDEWKDTRSGGDYVTGGRDAGSESVKENDENKHTGHLYGNIGITESTAMIAHELETRMKYNLYEIASRMFANEFLINIY